jgi:hypothetical protein
MPVGKDAAFSAIKDRFESSYVVYEKDQILILDAIPKETAKNVIRINSGGIGFSSTGINGVFNSAWTIDETLDMQQINVINLVADLIKGGPLKLGNFSNQSGTMGSCLKIVETSSFTPAVGGGGRYFIN